MTDPETDIDWRNLAISLRTTLDHLGPREHVKCLPGEADRGDCDGDEADHAAMFIAKLLATLEHFAHHLPDAVERGASLGRAYAEHACAYVNHCTQHEAQAGQLLEALGQRALTDHNGHRPVTGLKA